MKQSGLYVIAILILSLIGFFLNSFQIIVAGFLTLLVGMLLSYSSNRIDKRNNRTVLLVVFIVYYLSAFIVSFAFDSKSFFYVSDPMRDIDYVHSMKNLDTTTVLGYLYLCYFELADNNALFQMPLVLFGNMGRNSAGLIPTFFITQMIVAFGIWSSVFIHKLLRYYFEPQEAVKYALTFCLLSAYLLYSTVIIRDIIISFFYLVGFNIALSKFRLDKLLLLIVLLFVVWGIRLYSGFFYVVIIFFYLYRNMIKTKWKYLLIPMMIIGIAVGVASAGVLIDQSTEELASYEDLSKDREVSGGLSNSFSGLPVGVKQIVLLFFSEILPFPPYGVMLEASTLPQFFMGILCAIMSVWWFLVFYSLMALLFLRGGMRKLPLELLLFVGISVVFIMLNTAHVDIRRLLPVYPLLYAAYLYLKEREKPKVNGAIRKYIIIGYCFLIFAYTLIKL